MWLCSKGFMSKPSILFFARGYQADFFPELKSDRYDAVFATLTREESRQVEAKGCAVTACFEADFDAITPAPVPDDYLLTSYLSDRFLGRFDHAKRREILGKEIAFWGALLDTHKPAAVVNELVAIEISEVLLIECRKRNIPYLAGMNCVIDDLFYWLPDPMTISGKTFSLPTPGPASLAAADGYMAELAAKDYKPFYVQNLAGRLALKPLLVAFAKLALWQWRAFAGKLGGGFKYESYGNDYGKRISVYFKSLFRRYDQMADIPEGTDIVFYPLHQEPEATLSYMSEFYANQVATIENILKCLAPNQVLVVKEHPVDKGSLLQSKFWTMRENYSGLYFIPAEVHGRAVLARANRVATLTSTVGWEAANIGKQVLVLGEIFFDNLEGVPTPRDFRELRAALRAPADATPRLLPERSRDFVAAMAEVSYLGNPFPHDRLYTRENIGRIVDAVCAGAGIP